MHIHFCLQNHHCKQNIRILNNKIQRCCDEPSGNLRQKAKISISGPVFMENIDILFTTGFFHTNFDFLKIFH